MKLKWKQKSVDCRKRGKLGHNSRTCSFSSDGIEIQLSDYLRDLDSIMIEEASSCKNIEKLPIRIFKYSYLVFFIVAYLYNYSYLIF